MNFLFSRELPSSVSDDELLQAVKGEDANLDNRCSLTAQSDILLQSEHSSIDRFVNF